jgi:hypothetical protein
MGSLHHVAAVLTETSVLGDEIRLKQQARRQLSLPSSVRSHGRNAVRADRSAVAAESRIPGVFFYLSEISVHCWRVSGP